MFNNNQFHPSHSTDTKAAVHKNHKNEIREAHRNYTGLGPSESSNNVVQGIEEEPKHQGSIRSNEVSSKATHGMVTWVDPSMLDHPFDSCHWENTMVGTDIGGHNETSLQCQHAGGRYKFQSDCHLTGEGAATDDRHRVLKGRHI